MQSLDLRVLAKHAGFYPIKNLEGKTNFRLGLRVSHDGSVTQHVRLQVVDPRLREEIIFSHFIRSRARWIIREQVGITVNSRDKPWDFGVTISNGVEFNVEITAIAEDQDTFRKRSGEELLRNAINNKEIPLSLLRRLNKIFPNSNAQIVIDAAERALLPPTSPVTNPFSTGGPAVFIEDDPGPGKCLAELIQAAVDLKSKKAHADKDKTILILDNRTTHFDLIDFRDATKSLEQLRQKSPFLEVWFYTGYYSEQDGGDAEWSLIPISIPDAVVKRYAEKLVESGLTPNAAGIVHGGFDKASNSSTDDA